MVLCHPITKSDRSIKTSGSRTAYFLFKYVPLNRLSAMMGVKLGTWMTTREKIPMVSKIMANMINVII